MSDLSEAAAPANPNRCRRIREYLQIELDTEITGQRLQAQGDGRPAAYATKLSFTGGQRNGGLSERPMRHGVSSEHGHATGCRSARGFTSPKVSVNVNTHEVGGSL